MVLDPVEFSDHRCAIGIRKRSVGPLHAQRDRSLQREHYRIQSRVGGLQLGLHRICAAQKLIGLAALRLVLHQDGRCGWIVRRRVHVPSGSHLQHGFVLLFLGIRQRRQQVSGNVRIDAHDESVPPQLNGDIGHIVHDGNDVRGGLVSTLVANEVGSFLVH